MEFYEFLKKQNSVNGCLKLSWFFCHTVYAQLAISWPATFVSNVRDKPGSLRDLPGLLFYRFNEIFKSSSCSLSTGEGASIIISRP